MFESEHEAIKTIYDLSYIKLHDCCGIINNNNNNNNNNNLYLERVNTYVTPYGLVSEPTLIFPKALTC